MAGGELVLKMGKNPETGERNWDWINKMRMKKDIYLDF